MADIAPTAAQAGLMDELDAEPQAQTPAGIVAKKADGTMIEISPEGNVRELSEEDWKLEPVEPIGPEGEVIDSSAIELPSPELEEDPDAYKPPETALAVDVRDPSDVYRAMDRADEALILDELQGRALKAMVYSFKGGDGKLMTDLTVGGVNETVRLMNERGGTQVGISEQPPLVDETREGEKDYYRVMVFARDARFPQSGRWGTAIEPKMMEFKKGGEKWDKFALTKALNKAQRNALRAFIPEDFRQTIIAMFLGQDRVQELKPLGGGAVAELPPALNDERAQLLKKEIHEAYADLKALNRLRMPPARFNGFLTRAETESHERLEALRDQIRELVEQEKQRQTEAAS